MAFAWPCLPAGQKRSAGISSYSSAAHSVCWPTCSQDSAAELGRARLEAGLFRIPARPPHGFAWPQCGLVCTTDVHRAPAEEWHTEALVLYWHYNKTLLQAVEAVLGKSLPGRTYKYTSTSDLIRRQPPCQCQLWLELVWSLVLLRGSCSWQWGLTEDGRMDVSTHMIAWLHASKWLFSRVWLGNHVTLRFEDMFVQTASAACDFAD